MDRLRPPVRRVTVPVPPPDAPKAGVRGRPAAHAQDVPAAHAQGVPAAKSRAIPRPRRHTRYLLRLRLRQGQDGRRRRSQLPGQRLVDFITLKVIDNSHFNAPNQKTVVERWL